MRGRANQLLREARVLLKKATRAALGETGEFGSLGLPKRVKNLQRKALKEAAGTSQTAQKGWPRGYEFKVHRMTRKFRNDWIHEPEDSFAGKHAF
jgi:hypothetical protein